MGFDVNGVGDPAAVLEGGVGGSVDEAHRAAVGIFVRYEIEAVAPLPEVRFAAVGLSPCFDCRFEGRNHPVLGYLLKAVWSASSLLDVVG